MRQSLRRIAAVAAVAGLGTALAACGPQATPQARNDLALAPSASALPGWSMSDLAGLQPAVLGSDAAPLPHALPMRTSAPARYAPAPVFDYGSAPRQDIAYAPGAPADDYQWLALATALGGVLGQAPPDYAFDYQGVQPWAWETGDRYVRYAEPLPQGFRYYYYEPDSERPFLVRDPYYSYGYSDDRLVTIYDSRGRLIDARRAEREREAARSYFDRAQQLYRAAHRERRFGVAAAQWERQRAEIAREQQAALAARRERAAWQRWDAANQARLHRDWASEALVRRQAETGFAQWQRADYRTPPPTFYSAAERRAQLRQVAQLREERQLAQERRAQQAAQQQAHRQQVQQAQLAAERRQQVQQAQLAAERRQQEVHAARAQQAAQRQQRQERAQRAAAENRQADARQKQIEAQSRQRQQQQAQRVAAQKRQAAAREHQLEAQRAARVKADVLHKQQAQAAAQRQKAQAAAAHRQKAAAAQRANAQAAAERQKVQAAAAQREKAAAQRAKAQAAGERHKVQAAAAERQAQARKAAGQRHAEVARPQQAQKAHRGGNGHGQARQQR